MAVDEIPEPPESPFRKFALTLEVDDVLKGPASRGQRFTVVETVGKPGQPVMCVGHGDRNTFLGMFVVAGVVSPADGSGASYWTSLFRGLDTSGADYAEAVRAARMAAGVGPGPRMTATAANVCGGLVTVTGSSFPPGEEFFLNHPREAEADGAFRDTIVRADSSGAFRVQFRLPSDWCPLDWFVDAYARSPESPYQWPVAMAPLSANAAFVPLPPDAGNTKGPANETSHWPFSWRGIVLASAAFAVVGLALSRRRRPR